jgi:hypothetical protein
MRGLEEAWQNLVTSQNVDVPTSRGDFHCFGISRTESGSASLCCEAATTVRHEPDAGKTKDHHRPR